MSTLNPFLGFLGQTFKYINKFFELLLFTPSLISIFVTANVVIILKS